ncbi:MAG: BadF/BadG/BcrA/BcrD ATPase family protein [Bacteroidales bacterium]|nr:BadF/BadG/BcrA/BcrD ATPase family protein [Bacteroidales bacterium]
MIIGIDIGSTTTKSVAIYPDNTFKTLITKAFDPVTSATGALGKMMMENHIGISSIKNIVLTGVGASRVEGDLFGIPTSKIEEIQAVGLGGMYLSGKTDVVIASLGTGTALVEAHAGMINHIGGTGIGGGTLLGLAKTILNISDINTLFDLAEQGHTGTVDLQIGDIHDSDIGFLKKDMTAANFGKVTDNAKNEDIALGIMNLVYQVIGTVSAFAAKSRIIDTVVITGTASNTAVGKRILSNIAALYGMNFVYPEYSAYATAIGAALSKKLPLK